MTIEIKEGGISYIRITDNGTGIPKEQVKEAFLLPCYKQNVAD